MAYLGADNPRTAYMSSTPQRRDLLLHPPLPGLAVAAAPPPASHQSPRASPPSSAHQPATQCTHLPLPSRLRCTMGARPAAQGGRALAPPVPRSAVNSWALSSS